MPSDDERGLSFRRYSGLDEALFEKRIPFENHALIRSFVADIGIADYFETTSYIKAVRAGGGPDLRIAYGWSNGFTEDEVRSLVGADSIWRSDSRQGLWGVAHPVSGGTRGGGGSPGDRRDYGTCPQCFIAFSANGTCGCD